MINATPQIAAEFYGYNGSAGCVSSLWFLFNPRINLSPFTKDFRGEEHTNESIDLFLRSCFRAG